MGGGDSDDLDLKKNDRDEIQSLDFERRQLEVKMAIAKRQFEYWVGRIQNRFEIIILDIDRRELEVKMAMAKREFEYWEGRIQETIAKKGNIIGRAGGDSDNIREFEYREGQIQEIIVKKT